MQGFRVLGLRGLSVCCSRLNPFELTLGFEV